MDLSLRELMSYVPYLLESLLGLGFLKGFNYLVLLHAHPLLARVSVLAGEGFRTLWESLMPMAYFFILYSLLGPHLPTKAHDDLWQIGRIILAVQAARLAIALTLYLFELSWARRHKRADGQAVKALTKLMRFFAWMAALLFIANYLGYDISNALKGLGFLGVIASLAGQTIIADIFNYLAIYFDRPFEVGDYISLQQGVMGTVEYIGVKSTRIRSIGGQLVIVSNTQLMSGDVENHKSMEKRHVIFQMYLGAKTSSGDLSHLCLWIRQIIERARGAEFERIHLLKLVGANPVVEIAYFALTNDYNTYLDINHEIAMQIKQLCEHRSIQLGQALTFKDMDADLNSNSR